MAYYGKVYSMEFIYEISGFTSKGISMLGLSEAAEKLDCSAPYLLDQKLPVHK